MNLKQILEMIEEGIKFQEHCYIHQSLIKFSNSIIFSLIQKSKKWFEKNLKITPFAFSFPYGDTNDNIIALIRKEYKIAFVDKYNKGDCSNLYRVPRVPVNPKWSIKKFIRACRQDTKIIE